MKFMIDRFMFPLALQEIVSIKHTFVGLLYNGYFLLTLLGDSVYLQEYWGILGQLPDSDRF
jgi:hypothetical protein